MSEQVSTRHERVEEFGYRQELRRSLSFTDLLVYGLVFMVPIAPFGIFGSVFQGSGGMVVLAYVVGMIAMMFTALSYAQVSQAFPMAGSVYTYAGRGIGPPVGFWALTQGSRDWWRHAIAPTIGFAILAYVVINAQVAAQTLGFVWLGIGVAVLIGLMATGRRPELSGVAAEEKP